MRIPTDYMGQDAYSTHNRSLQRSHAMKQQRAFLSAAILSFGVGFGAAAQNPAAVTTPSTVSESVRSTTDAISGAARENMRPAVPGETPAARGKVEEAVRKSGPVEVQKLEPKR